MLPLAKAMAQQIAMVKLGGRLRHSVTFGKLLVVSVAKKARGLRWWASAIQSFFFTATITSNLLAHQISSFIETFFQAAWLYGNLRCDNRAKAPL